MEGSVDRISELPEATLHHILSFLLTKDAIQTAATCKILNQVWTTLPYLDFGPDFFPVLPIKVEGDIEDDDEEENEEEDNSEEEEEDHSQDEEEDNSEEEDDDDDDNVDISVGIDYFKVYSDEELSQIVRKREQLFAFMEQTLTRRRMHHLAIHKFRLGVATMDDELRHNLNRWMDYLVDCNIEELVLRLGPQRYALPLTAKSLYALNLKCCRMPSITLPSLRKLHLEYVFFDEHVLKNIINTCRSLEDLSIVRCGEFEDRIQISGPSPKLKVLKLTLDYEEVDEIVVEAQCLEKLTITGAPRPITINIITDFEASLKCLQLYGVRITNTWFCELISRLGHLEELHISSTRLKAIEISSTSLKRLTLWNALRCKDNIFGGFTINTPNLVYLNYTGGLTSRFLNRLAVKQVFFKIVDVTTIHGGDQLCSEFVQFLHVFNHSEVVTLHCKYFEDMIFPAEKRSKFIAPLAHIKHLILRGRFQLSPLYSLGNLLESLQWISPNLDTLSLKDSSVDSGFPIDLIIEFTGGHCDCSTFPWSCLRNCSSHGKFELKGGDAELSRFLTDSLSGNPELA